MHGRHRKKWTLRSWCTVLIQHHRGKRNSPFWEPSLCAKHLQLCRALTSLCAKYGQRQLPLLVAQQQRRTRSNLHTKPYKLAACTALLQTEGQSEESAQVIFLAPASATTLVKHCSAPAGKICFHSLLPKVCSPKFAPRSLLPKFAPQSLLPVPLDFPSNSSCCSGCLTFRL